MRVIGELARNNVLQVEKSPDIGESTAFNGKYPLAIPTFLNVDIDENDYILPTDGGDIYSKIYSNLLAHFVMYDNIMFNPLLTDSDMDDLDPTGTFFDDPDTFEARAQYGRGTDVSLYTASPLTGVAHASVALLPSNKTTTPQRDGLLITNTMDISTATSGAGAREFMVYWKIYQFDTTVDSRSGLGVYANTNDPSIRNIIEIDQEPSGFQAYISLDDGASWHPIGYLEPVAFCTAGTEIRLAFRNSSDVKYYIETYGIMF